MIAFTISLILFYHVNNSFGTRLPLEVFEIPQSTQVYNINSNSNNNNRNNSNNNNSNSNNDNSPGSNYIKHKSIYNHHADRRRSSRQMLESLQPQRILYQVGETEEDLPICAPNAVCSKIDLYETPWIERQCRCPETVYSKGYIINHHHPDHNNNYNNKFHSTTYLQADKKSSVIQPKYFNDYDNQKIEDIHIKKIMQKLQAVYKDDIMLDDNEFDINDELNNAYQTHRSEFPLIGNRKHTNNNNNNNYRSQSSIVKNREMNKLRHSGHKKDINYIGGCPSSIGVEDGHTIADKTRHYKLCNPVHKLPLCNSFRDYTWTLTTSPEMNVTEQIVHCRCRPNSVTYLTKWEPLGSGKAGYTYLFACSPQSRLRCQRKEPCKLFTVRKRQEFLDEVNTNPLCQCPKGHKCPKHHTDSGVIAGKSFIEDNIQTYSGYCMAND